MIKKIGRKIYYEVETGYPLVDTGERQGKTPPTTIEQDIQMFKVLSERNRETFDYIELQFGAYRQDFIEGQLIGIDLETKIPIFEYPNLDNPEEQIVPQRPLSVEIDDLKTENADLWYSVMLNEAKDDSQDNEIATLWYETMMMGGV